MKDDIRNALTIGFICVVAIWSAEKGFEIGYKKGKEKERERRTVNEMKDHWNKWYKEDN